MRSLSVPLALALPQNASTLRLPSSPLTCSRCKTFSTHSKPISFSFKRSVQPHTTMTTEVYLPMAPAEELLPTTAADRDAMAHFQNAFDACVSGWNCGDSLVLLQSNIQELFGDMLLQYFKHSLVQQVGQPVTFTFSHSGNGGQTIVQMPENKNAHLHLPTSANSQTQKCPQPAAHSSIMSAGIKKAPRPMNCWIIFRDAMHKKLKAENSHLTVQQICKPFVCIHARDGCR